MIRSLVLTLGFIGTTFALLWAVGGGKEETVVPDQVSRTAPDVMGLQPALSAVPAPSAKPTPQPAGGGVVVRDVVAAQDAPFVRPVARPGGLNPAPVIIPPKPANDSAARTPATTDERVNGAIEAMGYGILEELKKPLAQAPQAAQPAPKPVETARIAPEPEPVARTYTVQPGDSLPGIAFRFFGTTVAYLQILEANQDVLRTPTDLRAGMVLRIPE